MKSSKSNKPLERSPETEARIGALLAAPVEFAPEGNAAVSARTPVVLMTRLRLARNLARLPFSGWASEAQRRDILAECFPAILALPQMKRGSAFCMDELTDLEKQLLVERHLISRELCAAEVGSGVVISRDLSCVAMVNEEDHLRLAVIRPGFQLKRVWNAIDAIDTALEESLDYAFEQDLGYLTACPTNLGTGMRASAMMHLPALVITGQMEKVVRAVNQLGLVVRGLHGEGSDASGSIFQISNQTTLGEAESSIIKRLTSVLHTIIEQEHNAREKLIDGEPNKLFDKIGRAYGLLQNGYLLTSTEALNLLSLIRLGIDLQVFPETARERVDRLFILSQPGHVQFSARAESDAQRRDVLRAALLRAEFENFPRPVFNPSPRN